MSESAFRRTLGADGVEDLLTSESSLPLIPENERTIAWMLVGESSAHHVA